MAAGKMVPHEHWLTAHCHKSGTARCCHWPFFPAATGPTLLIMRIAHVPAKLKRL